MVGQHCDEQVCADTVVRAMPDRAQAEFGFQSPRPQPVHHILCCDFNVFRALKAENLPLLDRLHPVGNRLPVGLRHIPVRPEIEECLLANFCAIAQSLDQTIRMAGFTVRPIGRFGAPKKIAELPRMTLSTGYRIGEMISRPFYNYLAL